jgi:phage tail protein X
MAAAQITARQGDKLDQLLWRERAGAGRPDPLDANPGLADLGVILPLGTRVLVPAAPEATGTPSFPLSNSGADPPWTFALLLTRAPT